MRKTITFLLLFCTGLLFGQTPNNEDSISESLKEYMEGRQAIHLHLNKDRYFTGESIWFSAYVFDLSSGKISEQDTNLNVFLLDENGQELAKSLLITDNGRAQGEFLIGPKQEGRVLYIKAFTARMNSYYEDDSFVTAIELMGNEAGTESSSTTAELDIQILPEGGYPLVDVANNYGLKILDQNGLGLRLNEIELLDVKGELLLKGIQTNQFGMGKFVFTPNSRTGYTLRVKYNEEIIEKTLPEAMARGIGMRIDQNYARGDIEARIYTNEASLPFIQNDSLKLVVHKAEQNLSYYVKFEKGYNELKLMLPKGKLFPGVNTITLFNSTNEPLLERLVYNGGQRANKMNIAQQSEFRTDSTFVKINLNAEDSRPITSASISVLPSETVAAEQLPNIYASSQILPFINGHLEQPNYYFSDQSPQKLYALDLVLLNQGWSKYKWRNIFNNKKDQDYYFNGPGIGIEGYLRTTAESKPDKLLFYSKANEQVQYIPIDAEGKFQLNNINASRGTTFELAAMDENGKPVDCQFFYTVSPTSLDLQNPFGLRTMNPFIKYNSASGGYYTGFDPEAEKLEEIVVTAKKLKYEQFFRGWDARVIDKREKSRGNLGNFIGTYGYYRKGGSMVNLTTTPKGKFVEVTPVVIINGQGYPVGFAMDAINMQDVAEIYVKRPERSVLNTLANRIHIFMVFLEDDFSLAAPDKKSAKSFTLTEKGFSPKKKFYQPLYDYKSESFKALGTLGWFSELAPDANGVININYINPERDPSLIFIQGITSNGDPFSIVLTVPAGIND